MAYIANRPVRFDRNYAIGEVIPDAVIEPKMARRLAEMGRILCVELPGEEEAAGNAATGAQESGQGAEETNTQTDEKDRESGAEGLENTPSDGDNDVLAEGKSRKGKGQDSRKTEQPRAE